MKRLLEIALMLFCLGAILYSTFAKGQTVNLTRKYRVIAYKSGNPSVTSTSNETVVVPSMSLYVPNTFTPNGDGLNDNFGAYGESVTEFTMQIYDRWGEKIFECADVKKHWDGSYKGKPAPQGSYVYQITAQGADGHRTVKKGTVNLVM
jgi:gliding motility-associated-like protein